MKNYAMLLPLATLFVACRDEKKPSFVQPLVFQTTSSGIRPSGMIGYDSANKMIRSYVNSTPSAADSNLRSVVFDAKQIRRYLDSVPNSSQITHMKISFAHTWQYANSADSNTNASYRPNALTLVISALDAEGNYILLPDNQVLDLGSPCPPSCPAGDAASPYIIN